MANAKRTQKEIENDCKRLKEAAKTATSIKDLERKTKLSYQEIKTTLSKHPIIHNRIIEQIAQNKKHAKELKDLKDQEGLDKAEETKKEVKDEEKRRFVIDASITGIETLREDIAKICSTNSKIILTSVTVKELKMMQEFEDEQAKDANFILRQAVENEEDFEAVLIDESYDTPDECIVQYCAKNKGNVTLLTSDKEMVLRARMYSIHVCYMKQKTENSKGNAKPNSDIKTLTLAQRTKGKLYMPLLRKNTIEVRVYSDGIEYKEGEAELKIGDDVYIACKKPEYITFSHFKIVSLYAENNCRLIYGRRIYEDEDINMTNSSYKSFLKDFKRRLNL